MRLEFCLAPNGVFISILNLHQSPSEPLILHTDQTLLMLPPCAWPFLLPLLLSVLKGSWNVPWEGELVIHCTITEMYRPSFKHFTFLSQGPDWQPNTNSRFYATTNNMVSLLTSSETFWCHPYLKEPGSCNILVPFLTTSFFPSLFFFFNFPILVNKSAPGERGTLRALP